MGYYIDLSKITLEEFKNKLKNEYLLPSQQFLKENIDEQFSIIQNQNIVNLQQLQQELKTKEKVNAFAKTTSIGVDYLTVLRRTVNSYHPEARKLDQFPCISSETAQKLAKAGIKTTLDLYDRIITPQERNRLADELGISIEKALLLAKLTDICRLRYVNQTFAYLLVMLGYDTVELIQKADYRILHKKLLELNEEKNIFKGKIGLNDMAFLVNEARNATLDVEY
ncbi:MAG: DUF4332 domain-containing protein [Bacillota bacterium]